MIRKFHEAALTHSQALLAVSATLSAHPIYEGLSIEEVNDSGQLGALLYVLTYHRLRLSEELNQAFRTLGELSEEIGRRIEATPPEAVDVNASDAGLM